MSVARDYAERSVRGAATIRAPADQPGFAAAVPRGRARGGDERDQLAGGADAGGGRGTGARVVARPVLGGNPFTLGVASGDPLPDSVVLWTRLAPDPGNGGGMDPEPVAVRWEVAEDEAFATVVASGGATATPELAHSVHVDVTGLRARTALLLPVHGR